VVADTGDTVIRALHLIGAATWAGGLIFLAVAVSVVRRSVPAESRIELFRSLGRAFALVGGLALLLLIATGTDMASDHHAWDHLTDTTYGKTLLAKLILVGAVIILTLVHSLVQGPALSRLRQRALREPEDARLKARIRRRAAAFGIVSLLILLTTLAILVLAARLATIEDLIII
jgi:putative copper export protein